MWSWPENWPRAYNSFLISDLDKLDILDLDKLKTDPDDSNKLTFKINITNIDKLKIVLVHLNNSMML